MTILSSRKANVNLNSGGGDKKQGLAPKATFFFKAPFTGRQYSTDSGDGSDRFKLVCMNQLGGIGRGRSQLGPSADGTNCDDEDDLTLQYISEINSFIQKEVSSLITSHSLTSFNSGISFELCYVGEREQFLTDLFHAVNPTLLKSAVTFMNIREGHDISGNIFTHFSKPTFNTVQSTFPISLIQDSSGVKNRIVNLVLPSEIRNKINYVNERVSAGPPYYLKSSTKFGRHTLGLVNNNFVLDISSNPDAPYNNFRPIDLLLLDNFGRTRLNNLRVFHNQLGLPSNQFSGSIKRSDNWTYDNYNTNSKLSFTINWNHFEEGKHTYLTKTPDGGQHRTIITKSGSDNNPSTAFARFLTGYDVLEGTPFLANVIVRINLGPTQEYYQFEYPGAKNFWPPVGSGWEVGGDTFTFDANLLAYKPSNTRFGWEGTHPLNYTFNTSYPPGDYSMVFYPIEE